MTLYRANYYRFPPTHNQQSTEIYESYLPSAPSLET